MIKELFFVLSQAFSIIMPDGGLFEDTAVGDQPSNGFIGRSSMVVQSGQEIAGTINYRGALYALDNGGINLCNTSLFCDGCPPIPPQPVIPNDVPQGTGTAQIDIMVIYTDPVTGSVSQGGFAMLGVQQINQSFQNNNIDAVANLVHWEYVPGLPNNHTALGAVTFPATGDSAAEYVHTLRAQYNADQVTILTKNGCGAGFLAPQSPGLAFSYVGYDCFHGLTMVHELGHNLGAHHDIVNTTGMGGFLPDSYGWRFGQADYYRSIMSYLPGSRQNYWSDPTTNHPTSGDFTGVANVADNAKTLRITTQIMQNHTVSNASVIGLGKLWFDPITGGQYRPEMDVCLDVDFIRPNIFALLCRSAVLNPHPFQGGTLYLGGPFQRVTAKLTQPDQTVEFEPQGQPGETAYYQILFRNPGDIFDSYGIGMSNAVEYIH